MFLCACQHEEGLFVVRRHAARPGRSLCGGNVGIMCVCVCVWFQGVSGAPGLQGPPGPPGDRGEMVSGIKAFWTSNHECSDRQSYNVRRQKNVKTIICQESYQSLCSLNSCSSL